VSEKGEEVKMSKFGRIIEVIVVSSDLVPRRNAPRSVRKRVRRKGRGGIR